ncbi:hypothetical protein ACWD7M_16995 [Streptomyces griseus]
MPKRPRKIVRNPDAPIDLSGVPMTPAMKALKQLREAAGELLDLEQNLEVLATDMVEVTWAEGQIGRHILNAQGQPGNHRSYLYTRLEARGLKGRGAGWNSGSGVGARTRVPIDPLPVPDYLDESEVADVTETIAALREKLDRMMSRRDKQYPDEHKQRLAILDRRAAAPAKAS